MVWGESLPDALEMIFGKIAEFDRLRSLVGTFVLESVSAGSDIMENYSPPSLALGSFLVSVV